MVKCTLHSVSFLQIKAKAVKFNNELDLDIYLKLFGTDAMFLSLGDNMGWDDIMDQILKYLDEGIDKIKYFQVSVFMFIHQFIYNFLYFIFKIRYQSRRWLFYGAIM